MADLPILVSFSGGRTSAFLARMMQTSPRWEHRRKVYVFANTGRERKETLKFVQDCVDNWEFPVVWVEAVVSPKKGEVTTHRIVDYQTAVRNTDEDRPDHPFLDVVRKYGLPTNAFPHCTRELKLRPIRSYMLSLGLKDYETAIGMRADETRRTGAKDGIIYPLVEMGITEEIVRRFWDRQPFDLALKDYQGNCDLCFKKSLRKRLTMLRETPEIADFWARLEGRYTNVHGVGTDLVFDRHGISVPELVKMSQDPELEITVDKHDERLAKELVDPALAEKAMAANWDFESHCQCRNN